MNKIPRLKGASNYQRWLARMEPYLAYKGLLYLLNRKVDAEQSSPTPMDWRHTTPMRVTASPKAESDILLSKEGIDTPITTEKGKDLSGILLYQVISDLGITNRQFLRDDALCVHLIRSTIEDTVLDQIRHCKSAKATWDLLNTLYAKKGFSYSSSLYFELHTITLSQEGNSMEQYIAKIRRIHTDLADIGQKVEQQHLAALILQGLSAEYKQFITVQTQQFRMESALDLDRLAADLLDEERRIRRQPSALETLNYSAEAPIRAPALWITRLGNLAQ